MYFGKKNFALANICITVAAIMIIACCELGSADRSSGVCPPSYPRMVVYNSTGDCYPVGSQGPCGRMAVIASDPRQPNFGICNCKHYGHNNCFGRPLISHGDRCYFEFSQGPCKKNQWFIRNKYGRSECRKMPCPIMERQQDLLFAEFPENDFYFTIPGHNQCYKTGTQAFCNFGERAYFLGADTFPQCLRYDPYNCNAIPTPGSGIIGGTGDDYFYGEYYQPSQNQGLVGFGAPYEGI